MINPPESSINDEVENEALFASTGVQLYYPTPRFQNRRQKVFNTGDFTFVQGV